MDDGRPFLVGDQFSRADLTACALLSPACLRDDSEASPAEVLKFRNELKGRRLYRCVDVHVLDHRFADLRVGKHKEGPLRPWRILEQQSQGKAAIRQAVVVKPLWLAYWRRLLDFDVAQALIPFPRFGELRIAGDLAALTTLAKELAEKIDTRRPL